MYPTINLQPHSNGPEVKKLQDFLVSQGFMTPEQVSTGAGVYGPQTTAAVAAWQRAKGVNTAGNPGYWGPVSIAAANSISRNQGGQATTGAQTQDGATPMGPTSGGTAYFTGGQSLIQIPDAYGGTTGGSIWLVDPASKTVRPFASQQAFESAYAGDLANAKASIQQIHSTDLGEGGLLSGFHLLDHEYAIQPDGSAKTLDASPSQLQARYGKAKDTKSEQLASTSVGGFLNSLQKENSGISKSFIDGVKNNPSKVAFYINALAYGGYTLSDVYRDIKKSELVSEGNPTADAIQPISAAQTRGAYQNTDAGRAANTNQQIAPPQQIGTLDPQVLSLAIFDIPGEAFKTLVPQLDPTSTEFQALMDKVNTAYIDVLKLQVNATTEAEKAQADYLWQQFKNDTERTLGIKLSNNAIDAWKQIEGARDAFAQRGIEGSGIQEEQIDDYLRSVRRGDQMERVSTMTAEQQKQAEYFQKFATPAQVKQLIAEDQAKGLPRDQWRATQWGLVPSDEIKNSLSFSALKAKYPSMSDQEINSYIASVLDENGNYRSNLYQKQLKDEQKLAADKKTYQQQMVETDALNREQKAYAEFTKPDSPFLNAAVPSGAAGGDISKSSTAKPSEYTNLSSLMKGAIKPGQTTATTGQTQTPADTATQNERNMQAAGMSKEQMAAVKTGTVYNQPQKQTSTKTTTTPAPVEMGPKYVPPSLQASLKTLQDARTKNTATAIGKTPTASSATNSSFMQAPATSGQPKQPAQPTSGYKTFGTISAPQKKTVVEKVTSGVKNFFGGLFK